MKNCHVWQLNANSDPRCAERNALSAQEDAIIKRYNELQEELKRDLNKEAKALDIKRVYEATVKIQLAEHPWQRKIPKGAETVKFFSYIAAESLQALLDLEAKYSGFHVQEDLKSERSSVTYFRFNGVLMHEGGGYLLFKEPIAMNDEEWEQFKRGEIKEEWLNKGR